MRLSRIFVGESLAVGSRTTLDIAASHYIRNVLRLKESEVVVLFNDEDEADYHCLLEFSGKKTIAIIQSRHPSQIESVLDSEIILGLSRNDHLDLAIQKCTELGVNRISIFNAQHSQIPLKPAQREKRFAHWRAITVKACEQCGRYRLPVIEFFNSINEVLASDYQRQNRFLLDFTGSSLQEHLPSTQNRNQVSLLIGPEGGLSDTEITLARAQGFTGIRLGPRVLRTETAAMTSLAILQSVWGDLR